MKYLLLLIMGLNLTGTYAQNKLNKLSLNPIELLGYNRLNVEFERGFRQGKMGISLYIGHTGVASRKIHDEFSQLSEESVAVRFFTKAMDKSSYWYGAMISVSSGNITSADGLDRASNIGALGILGVTGYQFMIRSFFIDPFIGVGYAVTNDLFGSAEYTGDIGRPTDWLLTYGFKIGFCF